MLFWLKKAVSFWLMPLPFCLLLLVVGLWLTRSMKTVRRGRFLLGFAVLLLLSFSNKAMSKWMIRPLENVYPPVPELVAGVPLPANLAACRFVAVLGGGHGDTPGFSATNKLSNSSRGRLMEALRLLRALPEAKLVTSGRGAPNRPTHAAVVAQAAVSLGFDPTRIIRLDLPRDTEEEAVELRRVIGSQPFALVTSAWHLRRAVALMRRAGLNPLPCPADYLAGPSETADWTDYLWDSESVVRSTGALRERLGYVWSQLRGKV